MLECPEGLFASGVVLEKPIANMFAVRELRIRRGKSQGNLIRWRDSVAKPSEGCFSDVLQVIFRRTTTDDGDGRRRRTTDDDDDE